MTTQKHHDEAWQLAIKIVNTWSATVEFRTTLLPQLANLLAAQEERDALKEQCAVLQSQVDNADTTWQQQKIVSDQLRTDLAHIDEVLARRPALADEPNRCAKIEKAINVAGQADKFERKLISADLALKASCQCAEQFKHDCDQLRSELEIVTDKLCKLANRLGTELATAKAQITKLEQAPLCADHAEQLYCSRNTIKSDCLMCENEALRKVARAAFATLNGPVLTASYALKTYKEWQSELAELSAKGITL